MSERKRKAKKLAPLKGTPYRAKRLGIMNPYGGVWTPETFDNEAAALRYVENFWRGVKDVNLKKFKVVPVRVTVSLVRPNHSIGQDVQK